MPIIKSAKKRVKQTRKATIRNAKTKRSLRESLKKFTKAPSTDLLNDAQSNLDKAAKKGLVHKNKVARKKRQLAVIAKNAGVKPTPAKKTATKSPAKDKATTATKKVATAKKPATAKKTPAKKPATKK